MSFDLSFDHGRRLLEVRRSGLCDSAEAERYETEMKALLSVIQGAFHAPFDVLIDVTGGAVMPQQSTAPPLRVSKMLHTAGARRIAIVSQSAISTMQFRRLVDETENLRVFGTVADAQAWISQSSS